MYYIIHSGKVEFGPFDSLEDARIEAHDSCHDFPDELVVVKLVAGFTSQPSVKVTEYEKA